MNISHSHKLWLLPLFAVLAVLVWFDVRQPGSTSNAEATVGRPAQVGSSLQNRSPHGRQTQDNSISGSDTGTTGIELTTNPLVLRPLNQFTESLSRPLFSPSRSVYRPVAKIAIRKPAPRKVRKIKPAPNPFVVRGVILTTSARVALLHNKNNTRGISVREGDQLGVWRVIEIDSKSVTLRQHEKNTTLQVFSAKRTKMLAK